MYQRFSAVQSEPSADISKLVHTLTQGLETEADKAAILHRWLIGYLHYDHEYKAGNPSQRNQTVEKVLKSKKAVCQGYANVYAQLCQAAQIQCEVIYGYARTTETTDLQLEEPNHAWNALHIDGKWYLTDPTWDSDFLHHHALNEGPYYQADPQQFITTHYPAAPMWQLLPYPVPFSDFQKSETRIKQYLAGESEKMDTFYFTDSIRQFFQQTTFERKLYLAKSSYRLHPSQANAQALGAAFMDWEAHLSDHPPLTPNTAELISYHQQLVQLCQQAEFYSPIFPNQVENCAYNQINYAVALSRSLETAPNQQATKDILQLMKHELQTALETLLNLPENIMINQAIQQCKSYLEFCEDY